MKKNFLFLLLAFLCCGDAHAQWLPQADSIFGPYFSVYTLDAVDATTAWAGAGTSFPSTVPTMRPWIIRTTDGGKQWRYDTIPNTRGYGMGSLSALDANTCWASLAWADNPEKNRLYRTTDGGKNWEFQLQSTSAGSIVHFFDNQNGVLVRRDRSRYTSDGGTTWSAEQPTGLPDSVLYYLAGSYAAAGDTLWVSSPVSKLARSADRGKSWQTIALPFLGDTFSLSTLSFYDGQHGMAGIYYPPILYLTADGGQTWSQTPALPQPFADQNATLEAVEAIPGQPGWYIAQGSDFNLNIAQTYLTKDYGATWSLKDEQASMVYAAYAIEFTSKETGWAALNGFAESAACVYRWEKPLGIKAGDFPVTAYPAAADRGAAFGKKLSTPRKPAIEANAQKTNGEQGETH